MSANTLESDRYYLVSYAQNREDLYIQSMFPEDFKGFYIDVGSGHPIYHSVTKLLYKNGWHGINIDPNVEMIELSTYDRGRDVHVCCGVGAQNGRHIFRRYNNWGLSTFDPKLQKEYKKRPSEFTDKYEDIETTVRTLESICREYKVDAIDLLKVDVEGYESEVLTGNDWDRYRPKLICIESTHESNDWHAFLQKQHYKKVLSDGLNDYFVDEKSKQMSVPMHFPDTALVYPHIVDSDVAGYISLQQLRGETDDIIIKANRQPARKASVPLLKETVRLTLRELKFLTKEQNKPRRTILHPLRPIHALKNPADLKAYIEKTCEVYAQSFESLQEYEQSLIPKTKAGSILKRAKLAGYDAPKLIVKEAGKVVGRRVR